MLRDVPNISNAFVKEGFDPPICNHIRNVNKQALQNVCNADEEVRGDGVALPESMMALK
jgi:hypothetical protein